MPFQENELLFQFSFCFVHYFPTNHFVSSFFLLVRMGDFYLCRVFFVLFWWILSTWIKTKAYVSSGHSFSFLNSFLWLHTLWFCECFEGNSEFLISSSTISNNYFWWGFFVNYGNQDLYAFERILGMVE